MFRFTCILFFFVVGSFHQIGKSYPIIPKLDDQDDHDDLREPLENMTEENITHQLTYQDEDSRDFIGHSHDQDSDYESTTERQNYIATIKSLRARLRGLNKDLLDQHQEKNNAMDAFMKSLEHRNSIASKTHEISEERRSLEKDLFKVRSQLSDHEGSLRELKNRAQVARNSIKALEHTRISVLKQNKNINDDFQSHGLQHWVNSSLNKSPMNSIIRGAFVQGVTFVEPVLDGFERLTDVNNKVTNTMASELQRNLPLAARPFYAGFVTNLVLLTPVVLAVSIVLRIKRGFNRMTLGHLMILTNGYFALLSLGCFAATTFTSVDVLANLRHSDQAIFQLLMGVHAALFIALFVAHLTIAVRTKRKIAYIHTIMLFVVGSNFAIQAFGQSTKGELSKMDTMAYALNTTIFGLVLYHFASHLEELESLLTDPAVGNTYVYPPSATTTNDIYVPIERRPAVTIGNEPIGQRDSLGLNGPFKHHEQAPSRMLFRSDQRMNIGGVANNAAGTSVQYNDVDAELVVIDLDSPDEEPVQRRIIDIQNDHHFHDTEAFKSN